MERELGVAFRDDQVGRFPVEVTGIGVAGDAVTGDEKNLRWNRRCSFRYLKQDAVGGLCTGQEDIADSVNGQALIGITDVPCRSGGTGRHSSVAGSGEYMEHPVGGHRVQLAVLVVGEVDGAILACSYISDIAELVGVGGHSATERRSGTGVAAERQRAGQDLQSDGAADQLPDRTGLGVCEVKVS